MQPSAGEGNPLPKSRFGVFEFDPQVRELTKHGVRLKLQEQPIQILAALLEQAGQIVPREDLQRRLWPGGTFVDYEQSLNKAVNKLREALGDSAAKPIYIETLARRGYRFVAPVEVDRPRSETTQAALPSSLQLAPAPQRRTWLTWAAVAGACAAGVGTALLWLTRPPPPPRVTGTTQITNDGRPKTSPLLTDGARLFFNVAFGDYEGYQVSVKGGEPVALSLSVKNARLEDVSPDRTELLVCESPTGLPPCPLWSVPLLGGTARRLGDLLARRGSAAWSPDGQQVVYARGKELHIARRDGTEVRKLATVAGDPAWVRWSSDGSRVRFSVLAGVPPVASLWEARIDGSGAYPLLPGWKASPAACCGNWTPDGKYFVFQAGARETLNGNIWVLREKVGPFQRADRGPFQLTNGLLRAYWPVPSADGKRLFIDGYQPCNEFFRYDLKSGQIVPTLSGISGTELEFSKDGAWVAYVSTQDGSLWRSAADGSQRRQLTSPPILANHPHWAPDGKQIAFCGGRAEDPARIYVVSFDGGALQQVSHGEAWKRGDWDPSWSPDGVSLAFGANEPPEGGVSIQVADLRTGRVSALTGSEGMWSPRWSPNGRLIAGLSASGWRIVLYDFQTQKQSELYTQPSGFPSWSRDGESLFYITTGDDASWWRLRMRDRKTERVAPLKDKPGVTNWFAPAPNNSLIAARDVGTDEIYALDWDAP